MILRMSSRVSVGSSDTRIAGTCLLCCSQFDNIILQEIDALTVECLFWSAIVVRGKDPNTYVSYAKRMTGQYRQLRRKSPKNCPQITSMVLCLWLTILQYLLTFL